MDFNCNCFGVATAAKVPVKRYNLLVPDIFPVVEPDFHKPLSSSIERKIKKLSEYLERNEHRAPKVSRRLSRRLNKELHNGNNGYVKLCVRAYVRLLEDSRPELSNLFATEIVVKSAAKRKRDWMCRKTTPAHAGEGSMGSVVGVLLLHPDVEIRMLGVELFTEFTRLQTSSDYVSQLEGFVLLLCADANPKVPFAGGSQPAPPPEALAGLQATCLRALLEHLRYCARLAYVSHHLDAITYCMLDNIEDAGAAQGQGQSLLDAANRAREALQNGATPSSLAKLSVSSMVGVSAPQVSALLVFEEISHITRDAAEGKKVLEFLMRYLDGARGRWLGGPVLEAGMGTMRQACAEEHQRYLLYSSLMRHVGAPGLTAEQQVAVMQQALQDGLLLEQALAAPALLLALRQLPPVMQRYGGGVADAHTVVTVGAAETPRQGSAAAAATSTSPPQQQGQQQQGQQPEQQVELVQRQPMRSATRSPRSNGSDGAFGTPQAAVRFAVLSCISQLAACVGEAGPLMEVVASTVSRLAGPQDPTTTAAMECCIAAAEVIQSMPDEARVLFGHTFPQLLLQELMMVMVTWEVPHRLLAHRLLLLLLPAVGDGLKEWQARALLSTIWHEVALESNPPVVFAALDACFAALLGSSPAAALAEACRLVATLQAEVAAGGGRLLAVSAAACCALLCLCKSMLQQLAAILGHPALNDCAVPGCDEVLSSLAVRPSGLQLMGGSAAAPMPRYARSSSMAGAEWDAVSSTPPASATFGSLAEVAAVAFSEVEERRAEEFLAAWRAGTSPDKELGRFKAALAGAPLLRGRNHHHGAHGKLASVSAKFQALPVAFLAPRMKAGGVFGSGLGSQGGSASSAMESKWVQRVRDLYRTIPAMHDATVGGLQDVLQDSAASKGAAGASPAALSQQYLDALHESPLVGKTADEVLLEIDGTLAALEQQQQLAGGGGALERAEERVLA